MSQPPPRRALNWIPMWVPFGLALLAVLALVILGWVHSDNQNSQVNAQLGDLSSAASQNALAARANQDALARANACIRIRTCSRTVPTPAVSITEVPGPSGPSGPSGSPGHNVTVQEAERALALYCVDHDCSPVPTIAQVADAIAIYCNGHGQCRGPKGATGPSGAEGASGGSAPPLSADQVLTGVEQYCSANDGCAGPQGPSGASGQPGSPGASGAPGQPPESWTFAVGPIVYACDRTDPFNPTAPTYTCAPSLDGSATS